MAKLSIVAGATSQSVNIFIQNSGSTVGAGLTGLVFNTSGLLAYYTFTGTNTTSVAITLATLAAVTTAYSSGGFKEIDATNMPGLYRLDLPNTALATSKGRVVTVMLTGAASMAPVVLEIELTAVDNQSTAFGLSIAKTTNITGFNDIAATAVVSSGAITTSGGAVSTVTTVTNQLTAAQVATGVWQDATAGDFTASLSVGKSLMNGVALGTGLTVNNLTNAPTSGDFTSTMKTSIGTAVAASAVASVTGSVGSVTGLTASNLDTTVSSRMATYTQPTGFLAATFPTGTVANTTNITAGTITTTTNLTNAPTSGDLTSAMKSSVLTQVETALATDTYAEPGQGTPGTTVSLAAKIGYLYKAWRNLSTQTATQYSLTSGSDNATVDQKAAVSDDGTTFTRNNLTTGP